MVEAAKLYQDAPVAIKLRELQTLAEISREKNMVVVTSGGNVGETTGTVAGLTKAFGER
jgi:ABC-type enterochelin transport system substrate-binding protein